MLFYIIVCAFAVYGLLMAAITVLLYVPGTFHGTILVFAEPEVRMQIVRRLQWLRCLGFLSTDIYPASHSIDSENFQKSH